MDRKLSRDGPPSYMDMRGNVCVVLAACLEGRDDFVCHNLLRRRLDVDSVVAHIHTLENDIMGIRKLAFSEQNSPQELKRKETKQVNILI